MFGSALAQVMEILMRDIIDGAHIIMHDESILQTVQLKLFQSLIEREAIEDALIDEVLFEVYSLAALDIRVLLYHVDQIDDHLRLRPMQVRALMHPRHVVGHVLGQVGIHPDAYLAAVADEDHLFADIEVAHFLVQHLKALERGLQEAQLVCEWDVVDLLQSQVYLLQVEQSLVDGRAEVH